MNIGQLSINQATTETSSTTELVLACHEAGIHWVGLWRHKYIDNDVLRTRRLLDDHEVGVSSLCRGGFFTGTRSERDCITDNQRVIEEATVLGAPVIILVCGPVLSGGFRDAEAAISRGIERMLPIARDAGVTLAIEPFHPMFLAERSAIITLAQANQLVEKFAEPALGIALDTYHVWWDPSLAEELDRAKGQISILQVADWLVPTTEILRSRGLPGEGAIPLRSLLSMVEATGFYGQIEVEVLNPTIWARPVSSLVREIKVQMRQLFHGVTAGRPDVDPLVRI
jgi:sugar phosphate isomerase/epimerase